MSETIPEDVMKAARACLSPIFMQRLEQGQFDIVEASIALALLARDERAAKIIEDELVDIYEDSPDIDIECNNLCRRAASAIRDRSKS